MIASFFRGAVEEVPDKVWLLAGDDAYTYAQAQELVETAAASLRDAGVHRGDRVIVTARNTPEYLLTWFALMHLGAIQVPVNPKSTDTELAGFVQQVEPVLVVSDTNVADLFVARYAAPPLAEKDGSRTSDARAAIDPSTEYAGALMWNSGSDVISRSSAVSRSHHGNPVPAIT